MKLWLVGADLETSDRYLESQDEPSHEATVEADGGFEFRSVPEGWWLVGPAAALTFADTPDEDDIAPMATLVEVRAGELEKEVQIRAEHGLTIQGQVLQPDGTPAFSGIVRACSKAAPGWRFAPMRSDGTFTLGPLVGDQYELWASGDVEGAGSAMVSAFAGDDHVMLRLREGGSLSGRVIRERAAGDRGVSICVMRRDIEPHEILIATSDDGGFFRFENVDSGRYQVIARTDDAWFAVHSNLEVAGGRATDDVVLELREGGWLRVALRGRGKASVEVDCVEASQGEVRIDSLEVAQQEKRIAVPAGWITVDWKTRSRQAEERFEMHAGEERELHLEP
ncbi:MAG: carboxypeptidase regulatory-like domain-containing protein [Planctomycetes bacterium]|nr:carboxypeptidase regulatory-like domain-containing protein [Planctomycetota bacterium]